MAAIPQSTIDEIKDRVDIADVIGQYVVLKPQSGGRSWKGLCPFHDEKTPSFNVTPDRGTYYCFGCGEGGDVIAFLQNKENRSFPETVRQLAKECGIAIPEDAGRSEDRVGPLFEANEQAQEFFRSQLAGESGAEARRYLEGRGLDAESIEHFGIGFAPDRWDGLVRHLGQARVSLEAGEKAGLLAPPKESGRSRYDRFRGRVTFPICDVNRRVIAFGGRALGKDQQPKYLNSPESPLFTKRRVFYGLSEALAAIREKGRVVLCEGYFDRIALARAGITESVATCGTALTEEHAEELRRRRVVEIVLLFDGDAAGMKALERSLGVLLPRGLRVRGAVLPDGHDPDSYLVEHGNESLGSLVDQAPDAFEILTRLAVERGTSSPREKSDAVNYLANFVVLVPDPVESDEHVRRIAMALGADPESVGELVRSARRSSRSPETRSVREDFRVEPRKHEDEQRHLEGIVVLVANHAVLAQSALRPRIEGDLPNGAWKALLGSLLDAADNGCVDGEGRIDFSAVLDELDSDAQNRLAKIATLRLPPPRDVSPEEELGQRLEWFERMRQRKEASELTKKLSNPSEDADSVLAEKQRLIEARRAAQGLDPGAMP